MNGFPEKILLATDGLVSTATAARAAVELAKKGDAELHVVHVWHTVPSPHFDRVIRSELEVVGQDRLEQQVQWIEDAGGTVARAYLRKGRTVEGTVARRKVEMGSIEVMVSKEERGWR